MTWALAFLTLAAGAGWLSGRRTRTLTRLKVETDVLVNLPVGSEARAKLEEHIAWSVSAYLLERKQQDRTRTSRIATGASQIGALVLLLIAELNGAGFFDDWNKAPTWAIVTALTGAVIFAVSVVWELILVIREAKVMIEEIKHR